LRHALAGVVVGVFALLSTTMAEAQQASDDGATNSMYLRIFEAFEYVLSDETGTEKSVARPTSAVLRIPKDILLHIRFIFRKADLDPSRDRMPQLVCVSTTVISTSPPIATGGPSPSAGSVAPSPAGPVLTPIYLDDENQGKTQLLTQALIFSARRSLIEFGFFSPVGGACNVEANPERKFQLLVFVLDSGFSPKIADAFFVIGRTRLPATADPEAADSPNRQILWGRVGVNLFLGGEASGWLVSNVAVNVSALDFDGTNRLSPAIVFAVPGTRRGLFVGYGYNVGANVKDKDYIFFGTSFMGLKEFLDPRGKLLGGQ